MTQRTDRVDELLRQEIGDLIAREIGDPAVGFATVTDVETTPDLRHAKVWVSVIGQPEARQASVRALQHAMPFVRAQLGRRLRIKRIPEFTVRLDESVDRGARVLKLINELEAGVAPGDVTKGESLPTPQRGFAHDEDTGGQPAAEGTDEVTVAADAAAGPPKAMKPAKRTKRRADAPGRRPRARPRQANQ